MSETRIIREVRAQGLRCWTDSFRHHGNSALLLSLFGSRNAVRAIWATFFNRKRWPGIKVGTDEVFRLDEAPYTTIQTPLSKAALHTIIIHSGATRQRGAFLDEFYQIGPDAEKRFWATLTKSCPVPMRDAWQADVWALGLEHEVIDEVDGFGLPLYRIASSGDVWEPIIKAALQSGRIS